VNAAALAALKTDASHTEDRPFVDPSRDVVSARVRCGVVSFQMSHITQRQLQRLCGKRMRIGAA
jgi:hypothetical protein